MTSAGAENRDGADGEREDRLLPGDGDPGVHRVVAGSRVALPFVRLAREALDQPDRRERLVEPRDQSGLELLDALFPVHQRRDVVADAQVEKRHDGERQQRDRRVHPQENREHDDQRRDRGDEREAADQQVLHRVGVDVDAVDRVPGAGVDVVTEAERLEVLEEPVADRVDHPLSGIDLQLRAVGRHHLLGDLHQDAEHDHGHEQREPVAAVHDRRAIRRTARESAGRCST